MNVAFISSLNGGSGTFTIGLVKELSKHVERIDLYLFSNYNYMPALELPENVNIITIQKNGMLLLVKLLFCIHNLQGYDIIHINFASFFVPAYITKKLWNVPYIYTSHGCPQPEIEKGLSKFCYIFESCWVRFASKNAGRTIAISNYTKRLLQENYGVASEVIYHGIYPKFFKFDENARNNVRKSLNISYNIFIILFIGTFNKAKNARTLIGAMPYVVNKKDNIKLLLIGGGELYDQLIDEIKDLEIENFVIVKKHIPPPEISGYYSAADLFVLPSIIENFGLVLLEAMASELPVISSKFGACPEVIGNAGLLFDPKSSEDLADKIVDLMNSKELHENLKERGLERAKTFTWEKAAEQYYETYKNALEGR